MNMEDRLQICYSVLQKHEGTQKVMKRLLMTFLMIGLKDTVKLFVMKQIGGLIRYMYK